MEAHETEEWKLTGRLTDPITKAAERDRVFKATASSTLRSVSHGNLS